MNGHLSLIHSILPATVDLSVKIPDSHPSTRNLGSERVGSGTIVDPDGYILTVHYVTVGASSITVTLFEGEQYPGKIAAEDQETGIALVKISARELPFLKAAAPDSVNLGDPVVMIGAADRRGVCERRLRELEGALRWSTGIHARQNDSSDRIQPGLRRRNSGEFQRGVGRGRVVEFKRNRQIYRGDSDRILHGARAGAKAVRTGAKPAAPALVRFLSAGDGGSCGCGRGCAGSPAERFGIKEATSS